MNRKFLFLSLGVSSTLLLTLLGLGLTKNAFSSVRASLSETTLWKHYAAVEPTENSHGSKEFWASCDVLGQHVFEEPMEGIIEEAGDFSTSEYFDLLAYGDDRYVPSLFESRNAVYPEFTGKRTFTYGLYPQSVIYGDAALIATLNGLGEESKGPNGWYLYEGRYYAKMTTGYAASGQRFDNGESISVKKTYWFVCKPIEWNILSVSSEEAYALSSMVLDAKAYDSHTSNRTIEEKNISPNNYQYSEIREWLNEDFFSSAFALGNASLKTTEVDNSAKTTDTGTNPYASENTEDKVFLPSYRDYMNVDYGFINSEGVTSSRTSKSSEWSRAFGVTYEKADNVNKWNGNYWTRSPKSTYQRDVHLVESDGMINGGYSNYESGVRPAITLGL